MVVEGFGSTSGVQDLKLSAVGGLRSWLQGVGVFCLRFRGSRV